MIKYQAALFCRRLGVEFLGVLTELLETGFANVHHVTGFKILHGDIFGQKRR